jgi:branched-chain amino acid transport system permease protein
VPVAVSFDFVTAWSFWIGVGVVAGIYAIFTLGLQLNAGDTGILNFGQVGFVAIGAYSLAILVISAGIPVALAMGVSALLVALAAVLVGLPSLRLRGDYFAIATVCMAEAVRYIVLNAEGLTGGSQGTFALEISSGRAATASWLDASRWMQSTLFDPLGLGGREFALLPLFVVTLLVAVACAIVLTYLRATPWGRVLRAVRDDELAARAVGKPVFWCRLQSLLIAALLGGIAGWLLLLYLDSANPTSFEAQFTFVGYAILILAGVGRYWAILLASAVVWSVIEGLRFVDLPLAADKVAALRFVLVGVALLVLIEIRGWQRARA